MKYSKTYTWKIREFISCQYVFVPSGCVVFFLLVGVGGRGMCLEIGRKTRCRVQLAFWRVPALEEGALG